MLKEVFEVNLIDNELNPFEEAVIALSTMPKLNSLHLNLHEESQVDYVIRNLPNLKYLNGETIDRDELQDGNSQDGMTNEASRPHSNRSIKQINEAEEKEEDDFSDRPFESKSQSTPPGEGEKGVNSTFSNCTDGMNYSDSEEVSLKPRDLETIALIFDKIRGMHRKIKLSNDKQMANEFDKHLKG